jgi:hypothetical protein
MGLPPKGEIVARPMLTRACGCLQEFQYYADDRYRAQRQAKFQQTRCPACAAKLAEEQRMMPKGEAIKKLPPGTQLSLTLRPDGIWIGTLTAGGKAVEVAGTKNGGPQSVVVALAQLWVKEQGGATKQRTGEC